MRKSQKTTYLLVLLAILVSYIYWIIDSWYVYKINELCATDAFLGNIPAHAYFSRIVVTLISLSSAFLISYLYRDNEKMKYSLLKTVKLYQTTLSTVSEGLFDIDLEHNRIYYSDTFFRMLGYRPGEFPQNRKEWEKRIHPEDRKSAVAKINGYIKNSESFMIEYRMEKKDGSFIWIRSFGKTAQKDIEGNPLRVVGTIVDISMIKEKEPVDVENIIIL
ncbi:MAG TPA: PAS domain-containing protein [bacterium]|nr:PAS domain-containing protein [bacterium]HPS31170.1 PAS domain-containing protein [bacterium]